MSQSAPHRPLAGAIGTIIAMLAALAIWLPLPALAASETAVLKLANESFAANGAALKIEPVDGPPAYRRVLLDGRRAGYIASTRDVAGSVGYSGKPVDVLVAIDPDGRIAGAHLIQQSEPILTIGISEQDIANFVGNFAGLDFVHGSDVTAGPDAIAGATVSSGVIRDGIVRTVRAVMRATEASQTTAGPGFDLATFKPMTWTELVAAGIVQMRRITVGEARTSLGPGLFAAASVSDDALFSELFTAVLSPPMAGQNLLGKRDYTALVAAAPPDAALILVAGNGLYSFKGTDWRKTGVFDRLELRQGERTIKLTAEGYRNAESLHAEGAPTLREIGVFTVPADTGFDATRPWRLSLLAEEADPPATADFELAYETPQALLLTPPATSPASPAAADTATAGQPAPPARPLWMANWERRIPGIAVLVVMLTVLLAILFLQDMLARRRRLYRIVRIGFLATTFLVLGLLLGAQLSVVHVLTFAQALRTGFQWETFLLDPLVFILWSFVAAAMLFWGRGVFCGWLCPFGALQELVNEAARKIGIRQIDVPFGLQERLWPIKYLIFLGLFALSLGSITQAFTAAEIEPFKTVITMKGMRPWPFVAFALALLVAGLFIERFYCRFMCPLGAALAIPARLRMFEWLKRRYQCGKECRICAVHCTVQAIHPDGHINPNECIYCLNCQVNYYDNQTCPPLKARLRRAQALADAARPREAGNG